MNLLIAGWSGLCRKQMSKSRHFLQNISILNLVQVQPTPLNSKIWLRQFFCFVAERFCSWGTRCYVWVELVAALLPSHLNCIIGLFNFFSDIEHFSFWKIYTFAKLPHSLSGVLNVFHVVVFRQRDLHQRSTNITGGLWEIWGVMQTWFLVVYWTESCMTSMRRMLFKNDFLVTDFKLLKVSSLSSHFSVFDDERYLDNGLLILSNFPWSKGISVAEECEISEGSLPRP